MNPTHVRRFLLPAYITSVIAAGIGAVAVMVALGGDEPWGAHPATFALFAVFLLVTELAPMQSLTDDTELTGSWAFAFTLYFLAPPAAPLATVALVALVVGVVGRRGLSRSGFNAAQFTLSLALGGAAGGLITDLQSVADGAPVDAAWLFGVAVACSVGFACNSIFVAVAIALQQGLPIVEMIRRSIGINLGMDGLLLALTPVFVVVGREAVVLVPVLLLTMWVVYKSAAMALANTHEATHDQLTGIPNRRMFEDYAALRLEAAEGGERQAALLHIDLDGFKGINDRLGHHYGDLVLQQIGARLAEGGRNGDLAARLGGDEFAVLVGEVEDLDQAEAAAERFVELIRTPLDVEGVPLTVGASVGLSLFPRHGDDVDTLLHHADLAMYEAKAAGGGVKVYADGQRTRVPGRLTLLSELPDAIARDDLQLAYQPKIELATGDVVGVEALLRWDHSTHGRVDPAWFMPQAEQTELIAPLTDHILQLAARQSAEWSAEGTDVTVAVNVSTRNLHDPGFADRVATILRAHGVPPERFEIEITEDSVMADTDRSHTVLGQLRSLGVGVAIDDFGTGTSSLVTLRELPLDRIKIDRSFITGLTSSDGDLTIVRSLVELGHNLGLGTVAEGVESVEALELLTELGCQQAQGYLFARPKPAGLVTPLLRSGRVDLDALPPRPHAPQGSRS
ncbi:MAG: putative bifunctional diguanylate cyclase/phosphodiesterase [Acidimicrobiales bacterium]